MTLLEALAALVILGVSVIGYLELFHGAQRSLRLAGEWSAAAAHAATAIDEATLAPSAIRLASAPGAAVRVERRPWPGVARITDVVVTVTTSDGATMTVHRLTRPLP